MNRSVLGILMAMAGMVGGRPPEDEEPEDAQRLGPIRKRVQRRILEDAHDRATRFDLATERRLRRNATRLRHWKHYQATYYAARA